MKARSLTSLPDLISVYLLFTSGSKLPCEDSEFDCVLMADSIYTRSPVHFCLARGLSSPQGVRGRMDSSL